MFDATIDDVEQIVLRPITDPGGDELENGV